MLTEYMPNFADVFRTGVKFQSAEVFAQLFIKVLEKAQNGATWVIEDGQFHEIKFQDVWHPLMENE